MHPLCLPSVHCTTFSLPPQCSLHGPTICTQNLVSGAASKGIQTETKPSYFSILWGDIQPQQGETALYVFSSGESSK